MRGNWSPVAASKAQIRQAKSGVGIQSFWSWLPAPLFHKYCGNPHMRIMLKKRMDKDTYAWWIDEMRPTQRVGGTAGRFLLYGPYPDEETAARKIADLKKLPRYATADLVLSKQFGPAAGVY
jgi:hypothetical protein